MFEAVRESGEDFADLVDQRRGLKGDASAVFFDPWIPKTLALKVVKRVFRGVLVVVFPNANKARGESVAQFLAPRNAFGRGESFINEIKRRKNEQRLMRTLMRTPLRQRCGARA